MLRLLTGLFLMTSTYAYQQDLSKVPNGNMYGITLGHPGGSTRKATGFANSFYSVGQKWTKAFCQADADGDGQSNGFEMGDPCCVWSLGQAPMITTSLSDPNSAASKTTRQMPNCVQSMFMTQQNQQQMLQCPVCVQALQLEMAKPSDNAIDFILLSVKSCKGATQDDQQQVLCLKTLIKNADQLFNDQKNGISPIQSCMNLGLMCAVPVPTTQAPLPTTQAPMPTTQAPLPTAQAPVPTPPLPPIMYKGNTGNSNCNIGQSHSTLPGPGVCACGKARYDVASCDSDECYKLCDLRNTGHGVCTTKKLVSEMDNNEMVKVVAPVETAPVETASTNVLSGTALIVMVSVISTLATAAMVWGVSRLCSSNNKKEPMLDMLNDVDEQSFSALPDVDYNNKV
jgi:hypothetical protein